MTHSGTGGRDGFSGIRYEFDYHSDIGILEIITVGEIPKEMLNTLAAEGYAQLKKHECYKYLLNYTELSNIIGMFDMYERPKETSTIGITNQYAIALLTIDKYYEKIKFAETVYRNRGYKYKVFVDRDEAIKYLMDDAQF
jgi:hypothetical protein